MKMDTFKKPKMSYHLVYFCKKICLKKLSKIAQSGHTACNQYCVTGNRRRIKNAILFSKKFSDRDILKLQL